MRIYTGEKVRYVGKYRGFVTNIEDPDQQFRIKAIVPQVLGEVECNWALPMLPGGQNDPKLPELDEMVWIEFEDGDPNFPTWRGGFPSTAQGEKPVPSEARGEDGDTVLPPRGTSTRTLADGTELAEPAVAYAGAYGVESRKTRGGQRIEIDPTPDARRMAVMNEGNNFSMECNEQGCYRQRVSRCDTVCSGSNCQTNCGSCRCVNCGPCYTESRKDCNTVCKGKSGFTYNGDVRVVLGGGENQVICNGVLEITGSGQLKLSLGSAVGQAVAGNLQHGVMGAQENVILENKQEVIGNASARAIGKSVDVLTGKYQMKASTNEMNMDGLAVRLGDELLALSPLLKGTEVLTLLNAFIQWAMTHTHPSDGAPATPPWTGGLLTPGVHTSNKVFTE